MCARTAATKLKADFDLKPAMRGRTCSPAAFHGWYSPQTARPFGSGLEDHFGTLDKACLGFSEIVRDSWERLYLHQLCRKAGNTFG